MNIFQRAVFWGVMPIMFPLVGFCEDRADGEASQPISMKYFQEQSGRTEVDGSEAEVSYADNSLALEWSFLLLTVDHRESDWTRGDTLGSAAGENPWDSLTRIAPGVQYYQRFSSGWSVWGKFVALAGFEDAVSSRSWTYNPQILALYAPRDGWTMFGGVGTLHHPADPVVYPVLGLAVKGDRLSGAIGFPETMAKYRFDEKLALKGDVRWDIRMYQLADDNTLAARGYVRMKDIAPGLHLEYSATKGVTFRSGVRWFASREMTFFDSEENELSHHDMDASLSFSAGLDIKL